MDLLWGLSGKHPCVVHVSPLLLTREKLLPPETWEPNLYLPRELQIPIALINQKRLGHEFTSFPPTVVPFITLLPLPTHHVLRNFVLNH